MDQRAMAARQFAKNQVKKVTDYFKPTEKVRTRDFIREVPGAIAQTFSGTRDTVVKGGKILGEGLAYATSPNVRKMYRAGNTDILPTVSNTTPRQMLGNTAKSAFEIAPVGKIRGLATAAMSAKMTPRMAAGGAMGYGYDVADKMSLPEPISQSTFNPGIATLAGALMGGMSRPTSELLGQAGREIGDDIRNINPANRLSHRVVDKYDMEPVPGVFAPGGKQQMRPIMESFRKEVETTQMPFEPKSYLARVLMGKQSPVGMTIAGVKPDANGQFPTGSFSARFDKKPRIEIGDEGAFSPTKIDKEYGAFVDDSGKFPKTVGELFKHDELFNRYPELKNIEISQYNGRINGDMNTGGSYDPVANRISLNLENIKDKERLKSTLLHEIQHAIQQKEGFARGGVPNDYFESRKPIIKKLEKESQLLQRELDRVATGRYAGQKKKIDEVVKRIQANDSALKEAGLESKPGDAFNYYQRLGGELESRSVQRRMNMTPKERLSSDPYAAEAKATGIKGVDDVITRFDDGVANSVDPLLQEAKKYKSAEEFVKASIFSPARDSVARNTLRTEISKITEVRKADTLTPNPNNPSLDKSTINIKTEDITEGKRPYVLVDGDMIIDGHHAFEAYKKAGIEDIPVVTKSQLTELWKKATKK